MVLHAQIEHQLSKTIGFTQCGVTAYEIVFNVKNAR
jgi:hypothetical protein